jgi:hypothetical protein
MPSTVEIDKLKHDPRVLAIYQKYARLNRQGDKWVGKCPLHNENSGSFTVFAKDMLYHCFGCSASGNVVQLVQKMDKVEFTEAMDIVKNAIGEPTKWEQQKTVVEQTFRPVSEPQKKYQTISMTDFARYERNLKESKAGQEWLKTRGITLDTASLCHTGYVQNLGKLAPENCSDVADKGWLVFPCIQGDKIVSIKYRSVVRKAFSRQSGMATALYNTETIDPFDDVFLVEGEIDALTLEQAGFRAVSLASASAYPTPEQKDMLMKASRVFLAGDMDGAVGEVVMDKLWRELEDRTYRLKWPVGYKDANEVFLGKNNGDIPWFASEVQKLVHEAVKQPIPDVYDLKEVMVSSKQGSLADDPRRLRFPQPSVDKMAILLPGSVLGVYSTNTSMGKTPFVLQASMYNAIHRGDVVLNYQLELTPEEIATIVTAQILKKDRNNLTLEDRTIAAKFLDGVQYYVGHNPSLTTPDEVMDLIEAAVKRVGATIVILDTFHNVVVSESNGTAIETSLANRIKNMAMKYRLKWINVFQPRKAGQQSKGKKTHITDIRGAGAAADTCDAILALHRELARGTDDQPLDDIYEPKTLIQAQKTRAKGTGKSEAYLMFFGNFGTFEEIDFSHSEE